MYGLRSLSTRYRIPATYALPGVLGDASIVLILTKSGASGGVTFSHEGEVARARSGVECGAPALRGGVDVGAVRDERTRRVDRSRLRRRFEDPRGPFVRCERLGRPAERRQDGAPIVPGVRVRLGVGHRRRKRGHGKAARVVDVDLR